MSRTQLAEELERVRSELEDRSLDQGLGDVLAAEERAGLATRMRAALAGVVEGIVAESGGCDRATC